MKTRLLNSFGPVKHKFIKVRYLFQNLSFLIFVLIGSSVSKYYQLVWLIYAFTFFAQGVNVAKELKTGDLLVGSGDGMFTLCSESGFKALK